MLTGESRFHRRPARGFEPGSRVTGSKWVVHWTSETWWEWSEIAVRLQSLHRAPPSSRLRRLWSRKRDLQRAWNRERRAVWDQVGLSHCWYEGLVMVWDKACLRRGHRNDQSHRGHQCSETTLTGESRFHIRPPRSFEPRSLVTRLQALHKRLVITDRQKSGTHGRCCWFMSWFLWKFSIYIFCGRKYG
jgi:hypothetical protein